MTPIEMIVAERARQIAKGYDAAHDDEHKDGAIAFAALAHVAAAVREQSVADCYYPWGLGFREANDDTKMSLLTSSAALIVAEMERLMRRDGSLTGIVNAASDRFDAQPLHRAGIEAQAELRAEQGLSAIARLGIHEAFARLGLDPSALLVMEQGVHASSLTDVLTVAEDHIRALLGIIDRTGGFTSPSDQETIRAARKAVAGG
jgi:hypothetical protein